MATVNRSPVAPPEPLATNPVRALAGDLFNQVRVRQAFPPGPKDFDVRRTRDFTHDPLPILLSLYERYGPVFSVRVLHRRMVFMLGPEANQFVLVSHPELFHWREGFFGELTPRWATGCSTIDEAYHDRARAIMMPPSTASRSRPQPRR